MADLVGGFTMETASRGGRASRCTASGRVQIVHCPMTKDYELRDRVSRRRRAPSAARRGRGRGAAPATSRCSTPWPGNAGEIIAENRSTLFFVNSRRHAEKLARFINEGQPEPLAWSHHGSLSRELRLVVEQRLKRGELKAIVATSSLELGIDIGALDQVILVQTPFTVASAVQRLGRAGHRVGEPSRGRALPAARQGHRGRGGHGALRAGAGHRRDRARDLPAGRAGAGHRLHDVRGDVEGGRAVRLHPRRLPLPRRCPAGSSTSCWTCSPAATRRRGCATSRP